MYNKVKLIAVSLACCAFSMSAHAASVKGKLDTNSDGALSVEEFVMFSAQRDFKQRDANKDGVFSTKEWVGKSGGGFRHASLKLFDADRDGNMSASEVVDVYIWTFNNRDKNKDSQLTGGEIPSGMLKDKKTPQTKSAKTSKPEKKAKAFTKDVVLKKAVTQAVPKGAGESGYCCMIFDVSDKGKVSNVEINFCSNEIFERSSKLSFSFWEFEPAKLNGKPVTRRGVNRKATFHLKDAEGNLIPSSNGYLSRLDPNAKIPSEPKSSEARRNWLNKHFNMNRPCK